jgi:hypothetical protein
MSFEPRSPATVENRTNTGRLRDRRLRFGALEEAMRAGAARVHDAFRDALVVEVRDLFAQDEVFEQRRLQRVLVIGDRDPLVGRQYTPGRIDADPVQRAIVALLPSVARLPVF